MVLAGTSCFDEAIWTEIVILGSQFMTNLVRFFKSFLTDLIFLFLLFGFMVLFQDNHK